MTAADATRDDVFDLLVVGAGMAGLSAAATAAAEGARVLVVERAPQPGGSAAISGGYLWTAPTVAEMRQENPLGEAHLAELVVSGFDDAVDWVSSLGLAVGPRVPIYVGMGHQIDIRQYLQRCVARISQSGAILRSCRVKSLTTDAGAVTGADLVQTDGRSRVRARHTLLATGGFQASPTLRARYIHRNARRMLLRSNPFSDGAGLRLGTSVGAATSDRMNGFYGHLVGSPVDHFEEKDFGPLSQYLSEFGVLVNQAGVRFTDESGHDPLNAQAVLRQPGGRAWLVVDERIRTELIGRQHMPGLAYIDRFQTAVAAGASYLVTNTLEELAGGLSQHRVDGDAFLRTVRTYNTGVLLPDDPPRAGHHHPMTVGPFHALQVQPAITFTHGGLRVDGRTRVLDADGRPVPGLLAAGFDAGGVYHKAYAGGLAVALTLGRRAARTALENGRPDHAH